MSHDLDPCHPESYPRRILLAVTGLSPQVVTETIYSLCVERQPIFVPTEVHILTTEEGASRARLTLLDPEQGKFHQFCHDYDLANRMYFADASIHIIADKSGVTLPDIRTQEENAVAADAITALVGRLTSDENASLFVSIAGGRKTMGFYLGYALSLFARPQDRLSHVLVSAPFESNPEFYFPPRKPRVLYTRDNKPVLTSDARIMLADIPFVRLRQGMPESLLSGEESFSQTVQGLQESLATPELVVDFSLHGIYCGGKQLHLQPQLFAWFAWMAQRRMTIPEHGGHTRWTDGGEEHFLALYREVVGVDSADYESAKEDLSNGFTKEFFDQKISKVNRVLKTSLGPAARAYLITKPGLRPESRYGLVLAPEQITLRRF